MRSQLGLDTWNKAPIMLDACNLVCYEFIGESHSDSVFTRLLPFL